MEKERPGATPSWPDRLAGWPALAQGGLLFALVVLFHATLLHLPYFWDEGGYYVPAALDLFHHGTLIPEFTNAHPLLASIVLALLWHCFGVSIPVTRLTACVFAAGGLLAVFQLSRRLLNAGAAVALTALTGAYPIWFAQSSLAHADIFAAAFTLGGLAVYLTAPEQTALELPSGEQTLLRISSARRLRWAATLFSLAVLGKETALLQPLVLAFLELFAAYRSHGGERRAHLRWSGALMLPVPVLAVWFGYHRWKTGCTFGNPVFLRYNATGNLTVGHVVMALQYRFLHLFWQRNIWLPILFALACLFLPRRSDPGSLPLSPRVLRAIVVLILANWVAFSVLGGALLTRYLLPIYPLILLLCLWVWQRHTRQWPWLAALTLAAFVSAWWLNPPTYFAPEDNLTYRNMIVVHQAAIAYLRQQAPEATVLTAWPAAAELTRPELGYTDTPFKVFPLDNFSREQIAKAAEQPGQYDTALVFATHYVSPSLRTYLLHHPASRRGRKFAKERDLSPEEIAVMLGGRVVWQQDLDGEWAAVLRFNRGYNASASDPKQGELPLLSASR